MKFIEIEQQQSAPHLHTACHRKDQSMFSALRHRVIAHLCILIALAGTFTSPQFTQATGEHPQPTTQAVPAAPQHPLIIGQPDRLARFWHDQRWINGDYRACALYAQASLLEALGYDFQTELDLMRAQGIREGWYDPAHGTIGLGQPLRRHAIAFDPFGTPAAGDIHPQRALLRLQLELSAGRYVIANVNAQALDHYRGSAVVWHTLWITGLRLDRTGLPVSVFTNDSYRGAAIEYPIDQFLAAWGTPEFNYYAIFVTAWAIA